MRSDERRAILISVEDAFKARRQDSPSGAEISDWIEYWIRFGLTSEQVVSGCRRLCDPDKAGEFINPINIAKNSQSQGGKYQYFVPQGGREFGRDALRAWYRMQCCAFSNIPSGEVAYVILNYREHKAMEDAGICMVELSQANEDKFFRMREDFCSAFEDYAETDETARKMHEYRGVGMEHFKHQFYLKHKDRWEEEARHHRAGSFAK